jgi:hypothetical protein
MPHFHARSESKDNKSFQRQLFGELIAFAIRAGLISYECPYEIMDKNFYYIIVKLILKKMGISVEDIEEHVSFEVVGNTLEFQNNYFESFILSEDFDIPNIVMTLIYEVLRSLEYNNELIIDDEIKDDYFTDIFQTVFNMDFLLDILPKFGNRDMDCSRFDHALGTPYRLTCSKIKTFQFPGYKLMHNILIQSLLQFPLPVLDFGAGNCEVAKDMELKTELKVFTFDRINPDVDFSDTKSINIDGFQMTVVWPPPLDCEDDDCMGCIVCMYQIQKHGGVRKFWNDFKAITGEHYVKKIHIVMSSKSSGCKKFRQLVDGKQSDINGKQYDCEHIQSCIYFPQCNPYPEIVTYYKLDRKI